MTNPKKIDGYTVVEQIGAGSSSVVFKVADEDGEAFALKLFHNSLNLRGSLKKRLLSEARTLEKVKSPRVARLYKVGETEDSMYLVMELVAGEPLDIVAESKPLSGLQLMSAIAGLVEALRDTHACGVTHRDLKPANVILGPDGVKMIDFGLSTIEDANASTRSVISGGTPAWMSPEQAIGKPVGPSSDIFSLGLVIAFLTTGANPFGQGKPDALIYRIVNEEPDLEGIPEGLRPLVESCLKKDPAERPSIEQVQRFIYELGDEGLDSDATLVASQTLLANFGSNDHPGTPFSSKNRPRRKLGLVPKLTVGVVAVASILAVLALVPSSGQLNFDYVDRTTNNRPVFDSSILIQFADNSTREIQLPSGQTPSDLPDSFSEDAGEWKSGQVINFSVVSEIDDWSTGDTRVNFPRYFQLFRMGRPHTITMELTDARINFYASWGAINLDSDSTSSLVGFANRSDEAAYRNSRVSLLASCKRDEEEVIRGLVGGSLSFNSDYTSAKDEMYRNMPQTLSHASYRSRLSGLSEQMFLNQLSSVSPERNGNASQLSEQIILAVRDVYTTHYDLLDTVQWVGDTMVREPRYEGNYDELYSREFLLWGAAETSLAQATSRLRAEITSQAEFVCSADFPELQ